MILLALLAALLVQPPPPADALATVTAARAQATWAAQYATMTAPTATPIPTVTPTPTATPRPTVTMTPTPAASVTAQPTWTPQAPIIIVPTVIVNVERVEPLPTVDKLPDWAIVALGILVIVLIGSGLLIIVRNDR